MSQYQKLYTPEDSAVVFIDHQPQMTFGVAGADLEVRARRGYFAPIREKDQPTSEPPKEPEKEEAMEPS